jgi:hypothetical protein
MQSVRVGTCRWQALAGDEGFKESNQMHAINGCALLRHVMLVATSTVIIHHPRARSTSIEYTNVYQRIPTVLNA